MLGNSYNRMNRLKLLILIITAGFVLTTLGIWAMGCKGQNANTRGPVFAAVEKTLAQPGPVRDDLIKRGLALAPTTVNSGTPVYGVIQMGEIQKLVDEGIYAIDKQGFLIFGSSYIPPS